MPEKIRPLANDLKLPKVDWTPKKGDFYKRFIKELDFDIESKQRLTRETLNILGSCPNPPTEKEDFRSTGSVIGFVQSGKTTSFIALTMLALDNNFDLVLVLGGRIKNLLQQNVDEFERNLEYFSKNNFLSTFSVTDNLREIDSLPLSYLEETHPLIPRKPLVSIHLKHQSHIDRITRVLRKYRSLIKETNVLVIDDEADNASLNGLIAQGEETTIYKSIKKLRDVLPRHVLVQYTATPQALLLTSRTDHYSPEWVRFISPGKKYVGSKDFFHDESHVPVTIFNEDLPSTDANDLELPDSFSKALKTYLLTAAQSRFLPKLFNTNVTMMIHPDRRVIVHQKWGDLIEGLLEDWKFQIEENESGFLSHYRSDFKKAYQGLTASSESRVNKISDFDSLYELMPHVLRMVQVTVLNADSKNPHSRRDVYWQNPFHIVIGGDLLDRGFVVKGLVTTYMPRGSGVGNSDTIQQRGRFYGYKRDHLGFLRTWLSPDTEKAFRSYADTEEDLYARLKAFAFEGKPIQEWKRIMILDPILEPCRRNIIGIDLVPKYLDRNGWYWSTNPLSYTVNKSTIKELINKFEDDFIAYKNPRYDSTRWTEDAQCLIASDLSLLEVMEYLIDYSTDELDEGRWISTQTLIGSLIDKGYKASVILMGTQTLNLEQFPYRKRTLNRTEGKLISGYLHQGKNDNRDYPGEKEIYSKKPKEVTFQIHKLDLVYRERKTSSLVLAVKMPSKKNMIGELEGINILDFEMAYDD